MKHFIAILLLSSLLWSCKKHDDKPFPIVGQWEWYKSSGGLANVTMTPASTGLNWHLSVNTDMSCSQSGSLITPANGTYTLTQDNGPGGPYYYFNVFFPGETHQFNYYFISNDSLKLDDHIQLDGLSHFFVRKP